MTQTKSVIFLTFHEIMMSFFKKMAASAADQVARTADRKREYAQNVLETHSARLNAEQREKVERYAYGSQPEELRDFAQRMRQD